MALPASDLPPLNGSTACRQRLGLASTGLSSAHLRFQDAYCHDIDPSVQAAIQAGALLRGWPAGTVGLLGCFSSQGAEGHAVAWGGLSTTEHGRDAAGGWGVGPKRVN